MADQEDQEAPNDPSSDPGGVTPGRAGAIPDGADAHGEPRNARRTGIAWRVRHAARIILVIPVWLYQTVISPAIPPHCIYSPTCSEYTRQAIMRHGIAGAFAGILRVFRCVGGLYSGGADPVPERLTWSYLFGSYRRFWRARRK